MTPTVGRLLANQKFFLAEGAPNMILDLGRSVGHWLTRQRYGWSARLNPVPCSLPTTKSSPLIFQFARHSISTSDINQSHLSSSHNMPRPPKRTKWDLVSWYTRRQWINHCWCLCKDRHRRESNPPTVDRHYLATDRNPSQTKLSSKWSDVELAIKPTSRCSEHILHFYRAKHVRV